METSDNKILGRGVDILQVLTMNGRVTKDRESGYTGRAEANITTASPYIFTTVV